MYNLSHFQTRTPGYYILVEKMDQFSVRSCLLRALRRKLVLTNSITPRHFTITPLRLRGSPGGKEKQGAPPPSLQPYVDTRQKLLFSMLRCGISNPSFELLSATDVSNLQDDKRPYIFADFGVSV